MILELMDKLEQDSDSYWILYDLYIENSWASNDLVVTRICGVPRKSHSGLSYYSYLNGCSRSASGMALSRSSGNWHSLPL